MIYCEEKQSELRCISCQIPFKLIHSLITYVMTSEQADWLALPGYHVTVYARTCVPCGISEPLTNFSTLLSFIIFTDWSQQYYKDPTSIYLCKSHVLIFCKRILPNLVLWWQSPSLYCGQYGPKMSMDKKKLFENAYLIFWLLWSEERSCKELFNSHLSPTRCLSLMDTGGGTF